MNNIPEIKVGVVAVRRGCFPMTLSGTRGEGPGGGFVKKKGGGF